LHQSAQLTNGHGYLNGRSAPVAAANGEAVPFRRAPHNLEANEALLGAILVNNEAMDRVSSFLEPHHFFDPLHQQIFETARELIRAGRLATPITLRTYFESAPPVGNLTVPQYLGTLAANATTLINVVDYAQTIVDLAARRSLIVIGEDMVTGAYEISISSPELVRKTKGLLSEVESSGSGWPVVDASVLNRAVEAAPEIPLAGFGSKLSGYVRAAAAALGAPVDYLGLAIIAGAAGCIGARRFVEVWPGWKEPAILWAALVGDPSTNKTPATEPVREALAAVEAEKLDQHKPVEEAHAAASMQAKAVKRAWEKAVEKALRDGHDVPPMPDAAREPTAPIRPRTWVVNATIEKLARILAEQPGGVVNFSDELAGLFGSFDRYGGEGGDRAFYLELYGGRSYRIDRVKDGSIDIPHMAVSLLGTIQPDRLHRLVLSGDNDGLACRFLYAWPEARAKKRPASKPNLNVLVDAFKRLGSLEGSAVIPVSDEGSAAFEVWWTGVHDAATKAASGMLAEAYGKMNGGVLRIALLFEYLAWASADHGTNLEPRHVSLASIRSAIDFVESWAKPMARRVFAEVSVPLADRNAAVLARYLLNERPTAVNARQLRLTKKSALPGIRDAKAMDEACAALCDANWLRPVFTRAGDIKGRRAKSYDVNPGLSQICIPPNINSSVSSNRPEPSKPSGAIGANERPTLQG